MKPWPIERMEYYITYACRMHACIYICAHVFLEPRTWRLVIPPAMKVRGLSPPPPPPTLGFPGATPAADGSFPGSVGSGNGSWVRAGVGFLARDSPSSWPAKSPEDRLLHKDRTGVATGSIGTIGDSATGIALDKDVWKQTLNIKTQCWMPKYICKTINVQFEHLIFLFAPTTTSALCCKLLWSGLKWHVHAMLWNRRVALSIPKVLAGTVSWSCNGVPVAATVALLGRVQYSILSYVKVKIWVPDWFHNDMVGDINFLLKLLPRV